MNKKEAKNYYLNMDIPFNELIKPENSVEERYYRARKLEEQRIDAEDGFSDEYDEDFSNEF